MEGEGEGVVASGGGGGGVRKVGECGLGLVWPGEHCGGRAELSRPLPQRGEGGTHALGGADSSWKMASGLIINEVQAPPLCKIQLLHLSFYFINVIGLFISYVRVSSKEAGRFNYKILALRKSMLKVLNAVENLWSSCHLPLYTSLWKEHT